MTAAKTKTKTKANTNGHASSLSPFAIFAPYKGTPTCDDPRKIIVPIGAVHRDPSNANLHPERNIRGIRASLRRRGQTKPLVVDKDGMIIAGNGTHEGAELEKWTHVWIVTTHLTGPELLAYGIADNQLTRTSEWDWEKLATHITDLRAFDATEFAFSNDDFGFEEYELSPILAADWTKPAIKDDDDGNAPRANPGAPPPDEDDRVRNELSIALTPNMRVVVDRAIEKCRHFCGDADMSEGRCIELICADYLAAK